MTEYPLELNDCTDPRMFDFSDLNVAVGRSKFVYCSVSDERYESGDYLEEKEAPDFSVPDCIEPVYFSPEPIHSRQ